MHTIRNLILTAAVLALAPAPVLAADPPNAEEACSIVVTVDGKPTMVGPVADLHILRGPDQLGPVTSDKGKVNAIVCERTSIVPDDRDDRVVVQLNLPLFIKRATPKAMLVLGIKDGQYLATMPQGDMAPGDTEAITVKLNLFQDRANARYVAEHPKHP